MKGQGLLAQGRTRVEIPLRKGQRRRGRKPPGTGRGPCTASRAERAREPFPPLGPVTLAVPEPAQGRGQPESALRVASFQRPSESRAQVIVLGLQSVEQRNLIGSKEPRLGLFRQREKKALVTRLDRAGVARFKQPVTRILPHRLQQPVSRLPALILNDDEGFVHQLREKVQEIAHYQAIATADGLGGLQGAGPCERRQPAECSPLLLPQQIVTPVYRR